MDIQKTFEEVFDIIEHVDTAFDNELVNSESLEDMKSTINVFLPKYLNYLQDGISEMKELELESLKNKNDMLSQESFAKLIVGFSNTYYIFEEMDELLVNFNRNFLLKTGQATLEDLKKPLLSESEEVGEGDGE